MLCKLYFNFNNITCCCLILYFGNQVESITAVLHLFQLSLQKEHTHVSTARYDKMDQEMTRQCEDLTQMVSEKEKECLTWKTKSENIQNAVSEGTHGEAMPPRLRIGHDRTKQTEKVII